MKVLFVTRAIINPLKNDVMIQCLGNLCDLHVLRLSPEEVNDNIARNLKALNTDDYDCTILHLPFRKIRRKARLLNRMSNIAIYDYDTNRNFLKGDKYYKKYERFYRKLNNNVKIICTGYANSRKFINMGISTEFLTKGYDDRSLTDIKIERDIDLGFIGSVDLKLYKERRIFLETLADEFGVKIFRADSLDEYKKALNRIKIFVSADIGYGEYMSKNFEAMGCGCLLLAMRQGNGEEEALGLEDMENVVLYSDIDEARSKIRLLMEKPSLVEEIAEKGYLHAVNSFGAASKANSLFSMLKSNYEL